MKILVYTANFNHYDQIQYPVLDEVSTDYLYFIDSKQKNRVWNFQYVNWKEINSDPKRAISYYKVGMNDLPDHTISIWIDSSFKFLKPIRFLIKEFVKSKADIMGFKHFKRNCVYDEAQTCINLKLDNPDIINSQIKKYRRLHYPENNGLIETGIIIRKNNSKIKEFSKIWYEEYMSGSKRDQLSINYALSKSNVIFKYVSFPLRKNNYFKLTKHLHKIKNEK
jgi:hypothetical protein